MRHGPSTAIGLHLSATIWICDVNGVLVDSTPLVCQAFLATARRYGFAFTEPDRRRVKGLWLLEAYNRLDPGGDAAARRAFHQRYLRERVTEVPACAGVRDVLLAARDAGVRIGAATSHGEIAEACLVATGLYPLIDCLVTQEEVSRPKPQPDALLRVLALLGAPGRDPRHEALCVGDTPEDIEAGRAAGVRTVAVTYGMSDEREMRSARPDSIIHAFDEMQAWLGRRTARPVSRETSCPTFWG